MTDLCLMWGCRREVGHSGPHVGEPPCTHRECRDDDGHVDTCMFEGCDA